MFAECVSIAVGGLTKRKMCCSARCELTLQNHMCDLSGDCDADFDVRADSLANCFVGRGHLSFSFNLNKLGVRILRM